MKNITVMFFLTLCFISNINYAKAANNVMVVCDNCGPANMQTLALKQMQSQKIIRVEVVDPTGGIVRAYNVEHESEPGYTYTNITEVPADERWKTTALKAKKVLGDMAVAAAVESPLIQKVRSLYPSTLPNHISIVSIPLGITKSASEVIKGNEYNIYVSKYISDNTSLPKMDNTLLGSVFSSLVHAVIAVFKDGSMMVMVSKVSTLRYEPIGHYIDKNGSLRVVGTTGGGAVNGDRIDIDGSDDSDGSSATMNLRCTGWSEYQGTTADGLYCDGYSY